MLWVVGCGLWLVSCGLFDLVQQSFFLWNKKSSKSARNIFVFPLVDPLVVPLVFPLVFRQILLQVFLFFLSGDF
ncbi:hypothetical protein BZA77DRAFT_324316 [Pyronema omphalodes]|nr:hypothetical protein BZA77DRAFT_324316 [Pyronema omphalodes]